MVAAVVVVAAIAVRRRRQAMLQALAEQLFWRAGPGQRRVLLRSYYCSCRQRRGCLRAIACTFRRAAGETRIHCDNEAAASRRPSLGQVTEGHGRRVDTELIIHVL